MASTRSRSRGRWDHDDLARRLCYALNVAEQAVARLASDGYKDSGAPSANLRAEKVIAETAILLYGASAAGRHEQVKGAIDRVARGLVPYARGDRIRLGICFEPSLAFDFAEAHVCLSELGYRDQAIDRLLALSRAAQSVGGRERVPYRMLEQFWIEGLWTGQFTGSRDHRRLRGAQSVLNTPIDLLGGGREDRYAFTHAIMYVRDYNVAPARLPRPRAVILAEAEAALAKALDDDDFDLAGELLMAWPLTGASWSSAAAFGFRVLADIEDQNGYLPARGTPDARLATLSGDARDAYWLATSYHTIYVMGLLCAAAIDPGRAPPRQVRAAAIAPAGAAAMLLHKLDATVPHKTPIWRAAFDRLTPARQDALAGWLFTIALQRCARSRDIGGLHEWLRLGYDLGLAGLPVASQSAELLGRLALFDEISAPVVRSTPSALLHSNP